MSENYEQILSKVVSIIKEISRAEIETEILPESNLFSEKILDSVMLIDLLNRLESEFSIKVTTKEFVPENFTTADKITAAILRLKIENEKSKQ